MGCITQYALRNKNGLDKENSHSIMLLLLIFSGVFTYKCMSVTKILYNPETSYIFVFPCFS